MGTLKPQSNDNTAIGTLAVDGMRCCVWYSDEGPGWSLSRPVLSSPYHM